LTEGVVGRDDSFGAAAVELEAPLEVRWHLLDRKTWGGLVFTILVGVFTWAALVTDVHMRPLRLLALAVGITGVWLFALRRTMLAPARGAEPLMTTLLGTLSGLAAVTIVNFWLLDGLVPPETVLAMGVGVFVIAVTFQAIASRMGGPYRRVVVFGANEQSYELMRELEAESDTSFTCVGVIGEHPDPTKAEGIRVLGPKRDVVQIVSRQRPELLVCSSPRQRTEIVGRLLDAGITSVRVVDGLEFSEIAFGRLYSGRIRPSWFTSVLANEPRYHRPRAKRFFDFTFAAGALVLLSPLLLVVAALIRVSSPGPVLYRQVRSGEGGRLFVMLKFRSMVENAEELGRPVWATEHDPRVTRIGRVLRKARIDELPQLWNVLRGDMSIVGPRPERPEYHDLLRKEIPYWSRRHLIKPGITGWAQIHLAYADDISSARSKLAYDLYYLKHRTLALDFVILFRTIGVVLTGSGAR
jgi:exopolysaccharide biosynthesis polyprenyl glycosylphosphotransferase